MNIDCNSTAFPANWNALGPFDTPTVAPGAQMIPEYTIGTGQVHCIAFHPDYPNTPVVYAGSGFGGLFRSADGGDNWTPLTDFLEPISGVTDVVIHPGNPSVLFIATGNVDSDGTYSAGVFRSSNEGATWEPMNTGLLDGFEDYTVMRALRMDPLDTDHLLCATSAGIYECANANSTNPTWALRFSEASGRWKNIVFMNDPGNPGVVYASANDVYRSNDNGTTWQSWSAPFSFDFNAIGSAGETAMRINIGISTFGPERYLYAWVNLRATNNSYLRYRMARFNHATNAWDLAGPVHSAQVNGAAVWMGLSVSPTIPGRVAHSASKPLLSVDYGINRSQIGTRLTIHDDVHIMAYSPDGTELWVGHDGGLSMVDDADINGLSTPWVSRNNNLAVATIERIGFSPSDPTEVLIGNQDTGDNRRHSGLAGEALWSLVQGADGGSVSYSPDGTKAWTQSYNNRNRYYKWFNDFGTWHALDYLTGCCDTCECPSECADPIGICGAWGASMFPPFVTHPETNDWTFCIADAWMENDQEAASNVESDFTRLTQVQVDMGLITGDPAWFDNNCIGQGQERLAIAASDPAKIYIATSAVPDAPCAPNGKRPILMRSLPNGNGQLPPLGSGQPRFEVSPMPAAWLADMKYIKGLDVDPNDPDHIYIAFSGYNANLKVYESFDRGTTWSNTDPGNSLPNMPVNDLVAQQGTDGGIYIAMDIGVFYRNAETDWQPFCAGLPNVIVKDLDINYCAGKLRAGTYGRGLWESDLAEQPTVVRVIAENTTWSIHKNLGQDLRVASGATLTVTKTVNFAPNTALIIEPGAQVIVDGGLLTNLCGKEWKGVQVLGNSNLAQNTTNQGYFELRNGGTIDNAAIGILVGDLSDLTKGGGVVKIKGTQAQPGGIVRDCRPAIQFRPYARSRT
ncbi:MAG: hypothetical protein IPM12_02800 [Flavobacteriales bacterium]|nr:hypothetical protein [Flavobacteriales bacterium]